MPLRAPLPRATPEAPPATGPQLPRWVLAVILICCVIEAALLLGDVLGWPQIRQVALLYGAFWSPLMYGAQGMFPGQGVTMFVTHGFLHAGLLHLAMNMISLAAVAQALWRLMPARLMAATYAASQIAGAALHGWLVADSGPMIGASGAVFGLAGALVGYATIWRSRSGRALRPVLRAVAMVLGLNVALTLLMPQIAWQAHLGGGLAGLAIGVIAAIIREPKPR